MKLSEMIYQCRIGKLGLYPGYKGYFIWDYASNKLFYKNYDGDYFPAKNLQEWNVIKDSDKFYYIT